MRQIRIVMFLVLIFLLILMMIILGSIIRDFDYLIAFELAFLLILVIVLILFIQELRREEEVIVEKTVIIEKKEIKKPISAEKVPIFSNYFFGIVSIVLGFLAFISPINIFIYTVAVNICLVGIIIGIMGTKYDKKPKISYIGVIICLLVLLDLIIIMNIFLSEFPEE